MEIDNRALMSIASDGDCDCVSDPSVVAPPPPPPPPSGGDAKGTDSDLESSL